MQPNKTKAIENPTKIEYLNDFCVSSFTTTLNREEEAKRYMTTKINTIRNEKKPAPGTSKKESKNKNG